MTRILQQQHACSARRYHSLHLTFRSRTLERGWRLGAFVCLALLAAHALNSSCLLGDDIWTARLAAPAASHLLTLTIASQMVAGGGTPAFCLTHTCRCSLSSLLYFRGPLRCAPRNSLVSSLTAARTHVYHTRASLSGASHLPYTFSSRFGAVSINRFFPGNHRPMATALLCCRAGPSAPALACQYSALSGRNVSPSHLPLPRSVYQHAYVCIFIGTLGYLPQAKGENTYRRASPPSRRG